jgi:hypothetical protein
MTQPEALRLADALEKHLGGNTATQAAAELRRLHKVNKELLLEIIADIDRNYGTDYDYNKARAAIDKAEGENT